MELEIGTAIAAGLVGTLVMTMLMYMGPLMGIHMDLPMMLGTMAMKPGHAARMAGLAMHFMAGAAFFVVYAVVFDAAGIQSSFVGWSALFGLAHGVMAGLMMAMMGAMHPRMAAASTVHGGTVLAPGAFGINYGSMAPVAIVALHVVFAVVGGAVYGA